MQNKSKSIPGRELHEITVVDNTPVTEPSSIVPPQEIVEIPEEFRVSYCGISEEEFIKNGGKITPR